MGKTHHNTYTIKNMLSSVLCLSFVEVGTCMYMRMCQHTCKHTTYTHAQTQRSSKCKTVNYSYSIHMNGSVCTHTHTVYTHAHVPAHTHVHAHTRTHTHTIHAGKKLVEENNKRMHILVMNCEGIADYNKWSVSLNLFL
jgi:hypothetical protein